MASFGYRFGVLQSVRLFTILVKYLLFLGFLFILYQIKLKVPSHSLTNCSYPKFQKVSSHGNSMFGSQQVNGYEVQIYAATRQ